METITSGTQATIAPPPFVTRAPYEYQLKAAAALLQKETTPMIPLGRFETLKANVSVHVSPVGSGKTLTALMVARHPCMSPMDIPVDTFQKCGVDGSLPLVLNKRDVRCIDSTLIVAPKTLIGQWRACIRSCTNLGPADCAIIDGPVTQKLLDSIESPCHTASVVLCSPDASNKFPVSWYWRRVIIDEPEVIGKKRTWRLPKAAHVHLLTANLEEICAIPRSKGAIGELFHYLRDLSKTYNIDIVPRMVVKVGQDYYAECTMTPSYYAEVRVGPRCAVAEALKDTVGASEEVVVAVSIGDYVAAAKAMKLGGGKDADAVVLDTLEPFLEGVVQNATTKVAKLEERLEQLTADVTTPIEEVAKLEQRVRNLKEEYGRVTDELARAIDADRASGAGWPHKAAALGAALSKLPPGGKAIVFRQYSWARCLMP